MTRKVYVVEEIEWVSIGQRQSTVVGVFSTEEKANEYSQKRLNVFKGFYEYNVEERELDYDDLG